jgi:hypothetical protein
LAWPDNAGWTPTRPATALNKGARISRGPGVVTVGGMPTAATAKWRHAFAVQKTFLADTVTDALTMKL